MSSLFIACAICLLACQFSSAVILRPKWYPYFRRETQATSDSGTGTGQSGETLTARQARTVDMDKGSVCPDGQLTEECLSKIIMVVSKILQGNNQRYPF